MGHLILFVDDEKNILSSIKRLFFKDAYELLFAESAKEGLELLSHQSPAVIVTDMRMPEMDGIHFLQNAARLCPDAIRLVLSGYADIDSIMKAVNEGHIWRYITKPWNDADLRLAVKNAAEFYDKSMETKRLLEEVEMKNKELSRMNEILEEKVAERTRQLQHRSEILKMILDNVPAADILSKCCVFLSQTAGSGAAYIQVPFLDQTFSSHAGVIPDAAAVIAAESLESGKAVQRNNAFSVLLASADALLGIAVVFEIGKDKHKGAVNAVNDFSSVISIALAQQKMLKDAPQLLSHIDKFIGEME